MHRWHALNQVMVHNRGHPAPVPREAVHQLRFGLVLVHPSNALESAAERLDQDGAIGTKPRLFGTDLRVTIFPTSR
jgi:hypothetical protein